MIKQQNMWLILFLPVGQESDVVFICDLGHKTETESLQTLMEREGEIALLF